ncbi:MAG: sulfotransferase family protein [Candidatus Marinimicrobia bacterium]|nr:sulfotransferase family protein [Candidatus Neomarinimicrobiota bacterium]|tara:strand:- start:2318 stop:3031 length:714 start_codon:yes stop_codon:yes gene_type:complete
MWSGPRNISTAMMRSFENRPDTVVIDEPFYAYYLDKTGLDHPGKKDVFASQSIHWDEVVDICTGKIPEGKPIWYQKHMAQHNLEGCDLSWIKDVTNCFLIRDPKYVIASYGKRFPIENEKLLGFVQQADLLERVEKITGETPPILDSKDILANPEKMLLKLCEKIGISFTDKMLNWPAGKRHSDGVWAPYWYNRVEESTGFLPYSEENVELDETMEPIYEKCKEYYNILWNKRIGKN